LKNDKNNFIEAKTYKIIRIGDTTRTVVRNSSIGGALRLCGVGFTFVLGDVIQM